MRIIVYLFLALISITFSFFTAGIINLYLVDWSIVPLYAYFILFYFLFYLIYKIRFKNTRVLKIYLLRNILKLNKIIKLIDIKKVYYDKIELNSLQKRSIKTWNSLLQNSKSTLVASISTNTRIISKGSFTCILEVNKDITLTFIDSSINSIYYEIYLPQDTALEIATLFDKEQSVRLSKMNKEIKDSLELRILKEEIS